MQRAILRPLQVLPLRFVQGYSTYTEVDDVRDIYRRAEKTELVVEGLREGTNLVAEE